MPLIEPKSPWASTHGEKTSIPTIRIDLAEFGIGKLLSCGRLTSNTSANCPVPFPTWNESYAAPRASQVQRIAGSLLRDWLKRKQAKLTVSSLVLTALSLIGKAAHRTNSLVRYAD